MQSHNNFNYRELTEETGGRLSAGEDDFVADRCLSNCSSGSETNEDFRDTRADGGALTDVVGAVGLTLSTHASVIES